MSTEQSKQQVTEAHVEAVIDHWGRLSLPQLAEKIDLDLAVVEDIVEEIRKLQRADDDKNISVVACMTSDSIKSVVRCVGAKRGYCG